jgi:hypothetical protein
MILVSMWWNETKRALVLLSTQRPYNAVADGEKKKSRINLFYNGTKGGDNSKESHLKRSTRR